MEGYVVLLTITYAGKQTQDLGYLLHKNPYRAQSFDLSFGKAYVFYPEVTDERTTAGLCIFFIRKTMTERMSIIS